MFDIALDTKEYFSKIESEIKRSYEAANLARSKGLDPDIKVEIPLARNVAERVEGLISVVASQVRNSGISNRIRELESIYGKQNWKIAFLIAEEAANEKFCKFKDKKEAMEVGLRIGLAYITNGVVSSPLEGFVKLEIKKRRDGKEYFCLYFSGPIRSAGTTATCIFVAVCDYIRLKMGYAEYDPSEEEIKRTFSELEYFHDRITNLQYFPSEKEAEFMTRHLPLQIDGDPSEKLEVPNYKDLARINTNSLRGGFCLVMAEGLCQKSAKFWGKFSKFYKEFGMDHWVFLDGFTNLQKEVRAKGKIKKEVGAKISPDYNYIKDIVAGRPILGYPLRIGSFRLRYGRGRNSGFSGDALHPATLFLLDGFIAIGTQLKTERPGKATTTYVCDSIEGPIAKLNNGSVVFVDSLEKAKEIAKEVKEILFLGDILINYGDFLDRNHVLVPCGFNEEWWCLELEKACGEEKKSYLDIIAYPNKRISFEKSLELSLKYKIPLHPRFTYHWSDITKEQFLILLDWLSHCVVKDDKIIIPYFESESENSPKRILELIGIPHVFVNNEYVVVEDEWANGLRVSLGFYTKELNVENIKKCCDEDSVLNVVNKVSEVFVRDKSGTYIGARMGRPEKAKVRKLKGTPHSLFPVGKEGGRLRCFESALEKGKVTAQFPVYFCNSCSKITVYSVCHLCFKQADKKFYCKQCGINDGECGHNVSGFMDSALNIKEHFDSIIKKLGIRNVPELIKGVRGTSNKEHIPEHLAKGILRAYHNVFVNKDGTTRFDMTESPLTHFKPKEVGTSIERLKELGYNYDVFDNELVNEDQVLELKCQDIVLPSCPESLDEGADYVLFRVSKFLDDLLVKFYGVDPFYNLQKKEDLAGHLVVALSPHTSAGMVGRIVGFSKTQTMLAHPLLHSALRRDCFVHDTYLPIMKDGIWKNIKIGELVENLNPNKIVDIFGTLSKKIDDYYTIGMDFNGNTKVVKIKEFTKHNTSKILKIKLKDGRSLRLTDTHKILIQNDGILKKVLASELSIGMKLVVPIKNDVSSFDLYFIDLKKYFASRDDIMIRNVKETIKTAVKKFGSVASVRRFLNLSKSTFENFLYRDSYPLPLFLVLSSTIGINALPKSSYLTAKRDHVKFPNKIKLSEDVLNLIGLYVAEGHSRKRATGDKGLYQVSISATEEHIRNRIFKIMRENFGFKPTHVRNDSITYSSRLLYEFFVNILKCGSKAYEKRIPEIVLNLPLEKLKFFLQGYFDGDGSVSRTDCRVTCDSVSEGLLQDLEFCLRRFGIFTKRYWYKKQPGSKVKAFYLRKNREIPEFAITKLIIPSNYVKIFYHKIGFSLPRKEKILKYLIDNKKPTGMEIENNNLHAYPEIKEILEDGFETTYCLNVENHVVMANGLLVGQCDGDEAASMLLLDALLNFSPKLLSDHRGATQDEPLVLTSVIIPSEVDDMVFNMDVAWRYPLELYEAALEYKNPSEVKIETLRSRLGTPLEYGGFGFTHDTDNFNSGVRCSEYKTLPTMQDKVQRQMALCEKIRAVDVGDVAKLVIEKHFIRDIKGNLRKFSTQQFRCVNCNEKFRRPPLKGICSFCNGRIIFTVSEGTVIKYLGPSLSLAEKYSLPPYLKQTLQLAKQRIELLFGREKDKQEGLGKWFGV